MNHKRVERLMKGHRMAGFVPRKRRVTTTPSAHRIPDLLAGDFGTTRPDEAWVGDITYIRTRQGFLYLAFVLDLASRRVVGVSMASHMKASLVADALREAIGTRGGQVRGVVFHTDRGSQYTSRATAQLCGCAGIWHRTVGGTDRGVLGQRSRRVVPRHPQERTRQPEQLPKPPPRPPIDPMVDRSLVQPTPAPLHDRTTATKRMGGQLLPSHGRINQVSSTRGELQPPQDALSSQRRGSTKTPPKAAEAD